MEKFLIAMLEARDLNHVRFTLWSVLMLELLIYINIKKEYYSKEETEKYRVVGIEIEKI